MAEGGGEGGGGGRGSMPNAGSVECAKTPVQPRFDLGVTRRQLAH